MKPPTMAPTMPRAMSRKKPSPALLTILLAMKPEMRPRIIHAMIDITHLVCLETVRVNGDGIPSVQAWVLDQAPPRPERSKNLSNAGGVHACFAAAGIDQFRSSSRGEKPMQDAIITLTFDVYGT